MRDKTKQKDRKISEGRGPFSNAIKCKATAQHPARHGEANGSGSGGGSGSHGRTHTSTVGELERDGPELVLKVNPNPATTDRRRRSHQRWKRQGWVVHG